MKKLGFVFLLVAGLASPAMAGLVSVGSTYGPYQTGVGGEYTINVLANSLDASKYASTTQDILGGNSFQSFCLENSYPYEYLYTNTTYNAALNTKAIQGGTGTVTGDTLSQGTGWLYSQFAQGTLAGYAFSGTEAQREASANLLQQAIWWLEGEGGVAYSSGNQFMLAVVNQFGSQLNAKANGASQFNVYALNLTVAQTGGLAQDVLIHVPDGGTTLMLLGGALLGLGAMRRKFSA